MRFLSVLYNRIEQAIEFCLKSQTDLVAGLVVQW